jgi:hypothetical protein
LGIAIETVLEKSQKSENGLDNNLFLVALYVGAVRPYEGAPGINNSRASGLAANNAEPIFYWRHLSRGVVGGIAQEERVAGGDVPQRGTTRRVELPDVDADRKMVRTATIEMIVQHPAEVAEKIRGLADREGGSLVNSELRGDQDATAARLRIRVPADDLNRP